MADDEKKLKDSKAPKKEDPLVKELKDIFKDSLISVCKVEFTKEEEEGAEPKEGELAIPKTEEEIIAIINDLIDEKSVKLMENYKGKKARILPLSGLWQSCYDQKYELIRALSNPKTNKIMYDKGFIKGLVAAELLRNMCLQKLKRYILSMILVGSVSRGTMHEDSDVDISFVIDDTDVKKMSRHEVLARLRRMIHGMAAQTGFEFNIQVYLLTDFWQNLRDTHPVIFSMVRDGIPLYDTGMFIPWRTLLKMGKLRPSPEAVDQFYRTGRLLIQDINNNIKEMVIERVFLAMFNPAQAALMLIGVPPTDAINTPKVFKKHFVNELKLIEEKYADYLEDIIKLRKGVEYGKIKEISPEEFAKVMKQANDFQDRIEKLFTDIRNDNIKKSLEESENNCLEAVVKTLKAMGVKATTKDAVELMKEKLLDTGLITGADYYFISKKIKNAKMDFKRDLLTTEEAYTIEKEAKSFVNMMENLAQIYELKDTERSKIHFKYGSKNGEMWVLCDEVFIIKDLKQPEKEVVRSKLKSNGSFSDLKISNLKELNDARKKPACKDVVTTVKAETLESVKKYIGGDVEFVFA
ncbi:MAG: nucleotidyltransferase domain-containing protein [Nanoarchaeota archaeon]|nr:nucleotidyltransferase domain-containing protein [Nanoarchaeota archaeon]